MGAGGIIRLLTVSALGIVLAMFLAANKQGAMEQMDQMVQMGPQAAGARMVQARSSPANGSAKAEQPALTALMVVVAVVAVLVAALKRIIRRCAPLSGSPTSEDQGAAVAQGVAGAVVGLVVELVAAHSGYSWSGQLRQRPLR